MWNCVKGKGINWQLLPGFSTVIQYVIFHLLACTGSHFYSISLITLCIALFISISLYSASFLLLFIYSVISFLFPRSRSPSWRSTNGNSAELNIPSRTRSAFYSWMPRRYVTASLTSVRKQCTELIKTSLKTVSRICIRSDLTKLCTSSILLQIEDEAWPEMRKEYWKEWSCIKYFWTHVG